MTFMQENLEIAVVYLYQYMNTHRHNASGLVEQLGIDSW